MKVVAFSDPHGYLPKVKDFPECDVVCIAGDICPLDVQRDLVESISWFLLEFKPWAESLPCKKVIFVGGNHDFFLWHIGPQTNHTGSEVMKKLLRSKKGNSKLVYLQDSSYEFEGKRFYGTPWIEDLEKWAFYLPPEELEKKWSTIPKKFDVFISHMPPRRSGLGQVIQPGYNYGNDYGSQLLAEILGTRQFKYAICGHVHSGQHLPIDYCGCKYVNVSIKDEDYKVKYELFEFEI
jgi:Icc-related predicted phosphoesterase